MFRTAEPKMNIVFTTIYISLRDIIWIAIVNQSIHSVHYMQQQSFLYGLRKQFSKNKAATETTPLQLVQSSKINYFSLTYHTNNLLPNKLKTNN